MGTFTLFLALVAGHALGDYPLQGDFLSKAKNHRAPLPGVPWIQALTAHALIQGAIVAVIIARARPELAIVAPLFGYVEFIWHWIIDYYKNDGQYGAGELAFHLDQLFHVLTKLAIVVGLVLL